MDINSIGPVAICVAVTLVICPIFYHYWHPILIERRLIRLLPGWHLNHASDDGFVPRDFILGSTRLRLSNAELGTLDLVEFSPPVSWGIYRYLVVRIPCDGDSGIYGGLGRFISREYNSYYSTKLEAYARRKFANFIKGNLLMDSAECCVVEDGHASFYIKLPQVGLGRAGKHTLQVLDNLASDE